MNYAYYPGCSLECSSAAYDVSVRAVADLLGINLMELDDGTVAAPPSILPKMS